MELNTEVKSYLEEVKTSTLEALSKQVDAWKRHYTELKEAGADSKKAVDDLQLMMDRALRRIEENEKALRAPIGSPGSPYSLKSAGEMVVEAEGLAEFIGRVKAGDGKKGMVKGAQFTIPIKSLFPNDFESKTTITSADIGNATPGILTAQRLPGVIRPGMRMIRIRDLFPRFTTTQNSIEFLKENAFTNAASPQAEAQNKAESALTFTIDYANVKTLAHWIPATRQILDDLPMLRGYVDQRLMEGLKDVEDAELWSGDGTGQHLSGFTVNAAAYETGRNVSGDTKFDKLNHALSQVEDAKMIPSGIAVKFSDWRKMELIKEDVSGANTGRYILGGPKGLSEPYIWGLPVARSHEIDEGTFGVGAFDTYAAVWDRMDAEIAVSTEHSDYFVKNMVAVRCEERLTATFYRSDAFVYGAY